MGRSLVLLTCLAVVLVLAAPAQATSTLTKSQAYRTARLCLLDRGAQFVGRRPDGGGYATFKTGSTFWTYKTFLGQVSSATVYFAGRPGLTTAKKRTVKACLTKGI